MEPTRTTGGMSPLTLGTGKVTKHWDMDKIELHLNPSDYSSLITSRNNEIFTMVEPQNEDVDSPRTIPPRGTEISLPKTYVTRSGTLFIYSDSKVIKDNQKYFPKFRSVNLDVKGQGVTIPSRGHPWSNNHKKDPPSTPANAARIRAKENKLYVKSYEATHQRKPYSWNYAVTPVKIINPDHMTDIQTVKNLTEAALTYKQNQNPEEEHYLDLIRRTWENREDMEKKKALRANRHFSKWTQEWINSHRNLMNSPLPRSIHKLSRDNTTYSTKSVTFGIQKMGQEPKNTPRPPSSTSPCRRYPSPYRRSRTNPLGLIRNTFASNPDTR